MREDDPVLRRQERRPRRVGQVEERAAGLLGPQGDGGHGGFQRRKADVLETLDFFKGFGAFAGRAAPDQLTQVQGVARHRIKGLTRHARGEIFAVKRLFFGRINDRHAVVQRRQGRFAQQNQAGKRGKRLFAQEGQRGREEKAGASDPRKRALCHPDHRENAPGKQYPSGHLQFPGRRNTGRIQRRSVLCGRGFRPRGICRGHACGGGACGGGVCRGGACGRGFRPRGIYGDGAGKAGDGESGGALFIDKSAHAVQIIAALPEHRIGLGRGKREDVAGLRRDPVQLRKGRIALVGQRAEERAPDVVGPETRVAGIVRQGIGRFAQDGRARGRGHFSDFCHVT